MGAPALLGRFEQVEPVLLVLDRTGMDDRTAAALIAGLPTLRRTVLLDGRPLPDGVRADRLADLRAAASDAPVWERRPFDAPLFVMFSSGTTGPPKAMVHGAGGTLLEHVKEHRLHGDLRPGDTLYFHTTTAWMMWNWQLSALAVGAQSSLYDGPVRGPETLWRARRRARRDGVRDQPGLPAAVPGLRLPPAREVDARWLRAMLSTGAVLHDGSSTGWPSAVGPVPLQSISGGTDIIGCFVLGHPSCRSDAGRCQSRSLGLDVGAVDEDGDEWSASASWSAAVPSRPARWASAAIATAPGSTAPTSPSNPGMWTHGDLIEFDADGSARLHGRSDGVLNIDGVRIGPSEIYTVLRGLPQVADTMAVEQRDPERPGGTRMVLLVVLRPGASSTATWTDDPADAAPEASAAHVPALVAAVPELPLTHNGKRSERPPGTR